MPRPFTENEREQIRRSLLERGGELFAAHGLRKTTVEELAEAAGISKAAFYLFFESKEALFMDIAELAEQDYRAQVLALVDRPGPTARARLAAVLRQAFRVWKDIPVLRAVAVPGRGDYEALRRRVPEDRLAQHQSADRAFVEALIARCREAGIPVQAPAEAIQGLLYALFLVTLHEDDFGPGQMAPTIDRLVELVAADCLNEAAL